MGLMRRIRLIALGATLAYFFDPANGKERRKAATKKLAHAVDRIGQKVKSKPEDELLARKVEAELFSDAELPTDRIDVNAESGKIVLSGEADSPELIDELVARAHKVEGVEQVESLLQTPAGPAPAPE
jgi:osmotically-inducible protein OsmY